MYETLMNLPLFRGAAQSQIFSFIEKTNLDFRSYNPEDLIVEEGDICGTLRCLVSGSMEITHRIFEGEVIVTERLDAPSFIAPDRLFGIDNRIPYSVRAVSRCGTLDIEKSEYLDLLMGNHVFMLNYLNLLSLVAQRDYSVIKGAKSGSAASFLSMILQRTTSRLSADVRIETVRQTIRELFNSSVPDGASRLQELVTANIIEITSPSLLHVLDRNALMDHSD